MINNKNKSRVLVIGGGGFIGTHLVMTLLSKGQNVRVIEHSNREKSINHPNLEWIAGDYGNKNFLEYSLKEVDLIFHLSSTTQPQTSNVNPIFDIQSNLINTINLLDHLRYMPKVPIIFLSSGGTVYGIPKQIPIPENHQTQPQCSYGIVKLTIEKYLAFYHLTYGINYRIIRLANPYGPGQLNLKQGVIGAFLLRVLKNEQLVVWGDGTIIRDYIYISDTINALILAAEYQGKERIFNIGSGSGRSILEIINEIENIIDKKTNTIFSVKREFDVSISILDISLAEKELGWKPIISLDQGLSKTLEWMKTLNLNN
jgi:UDP-glucose 4-epimerase